jgi:hypothetical protein
MRTPNLLIIPSPGQADQRLGLGEPGPAVTDLGQQAGGADGARAGQRGEDVPVGVFGELGGDLGVQRFDLGVQAGQHDRAYLLIFHKARSAAFTPAESASLLARRPYDLRHAAVSTWLNAGVPAPQVADWAGHSVDVLLRVYAKCISGQQHEAKRRIEEATMPREDEYMPWTSR